MVESPSRLSSMNGDRVDGGATIGEFLTFLAPRVWREGDAAPVWPPDMFGAVASVLRRSGAYTRLVAQWPPRGKDDLAEWTESISRQAKKWVDAIERGEPTPRGITSWWKSLRGHADQELCKAPENRRLCETLLQLLAVSDEACRDIGMPATAHLRKKIHRMAREQLFREPSTLASGIHPSRLRVLPKRRVPRAGLSMRSLSHHLALCPPSEVTPYWQFNEPRDRHEMDLLLVPWPERVSDREFVPLPKTTVGLAAGYGHFAYSPRRDKDSADLLASRVEKLIRKAGNDLLAVVFPELSLTEEEFTAVRTVTTRNRLILVAGIVQAPGETPSIVRNVVRTVIPSADSTAHYTKVEQSKHHRWQLDPGQIRRYKLKLSDENVGAWWEAISVDRREISFHSLRDDLTFCTLICEDLARPDPVGEIVRAVGPDLVIALLMDGEQLPFRWGARHAGVLSEDPGSAVLTLTSEGMARLSSESPTAPLTIALWRDPTRSEALPIQLKPHHHGVLLKLKSQSPNNGIQVTADGRVDRHKGWTVGLHEALSIKG